MAEIRGYEYLDHSDFVSLVQSHYNKFCDCNSYEEEFHSMNELDDVFADKTATDIILSVNKDQFNISHDYFYFDGYGHANSFNSFDTYIERVVDDSAFLDWCDEMGYLDDYKNKEGD